MVTGILICAIGLLPLFLALSISKVYNETKLSVGMVISMILITIWQLDIGVLYLQDVLSEGLVLFLFKLFRIGPTFSLPIVLYVAYWIIKNQPSVIKKVNGLTKIKYALFTKKALIGFAIWSTIVYIISWTSLGIKGLVVTEESIASNHYLPDYGPLVWVYIFHMGIIVFFLFVVCVLSGRIRNSHFKNFLRGFSFNALFLILPGILNFLPLTGVLTSSIGVILFSVASMHIFVKFNVDLKSYNHELMEKQKKLDYTGQLTGSLIHEVKNTNVIIKSFSSMLEKSDALIERDKRTLEMIGKSSEHLEQLADNYRAYMKSSAMTFKTDDLAEIVQASIDFSAGMLQENNVKLEFINIYSPLNVYLNKANLQQVFINLIKNSVEAMPENRANKKITIRTEIDDKNIIIHFKDNGKGICPENWVSVFDPFISLGNKKRGMGLGLPFVKKMMIEHLGDIHIVESSSNGTHFKLEIPQEGMLRGGNYQKPPQ
ncbi:Histidine kinase-, DNA gyrase B-, and HSP90-like ATPase [Terribacillus aidingensis]|uniref:histidine kinase n=1 Tax=Terribacillus aidingensis TaxID=586416 RepID=A0A285N125_9BACI|nr:HAMP domain-containing sensor histidine kinase [Terribacillus aidingensis]SNZ03149.1 Histidine kinase-, DNA gyrase B-, and HSP90-like ATPase [Terribacillus aidingensis]